MNYRTKTKTKTKKMTADCLYCGEDVYVGRDPQIGNFVSCDSCDSQFEVIDLEPIMVDWPYYDHNFEEARNSPIASMTYKY
jgi:transcription elongation factor Elf1